MYFKNGCYFKFIIVFWVFVFKCCWLVVVLRELGYEFSVIGVDLVKFVGL